MKTLLTTIIILLITITSYSQEYDVKKPINQVTRQKDQSISSISIQNEYIIIHGKDSGIFKIKEISKDNTYYYAESLLEVISITLNNGKGTYKNLTTNKTITFNY